MKENTTNETILTPFCNISEASRRTGLSKFFIRQNIDNIPHCKSGKKYLIHIEGLKEFALKTDKTA